MNRKTKLSSLTTNQIEDSSFFWYSLEKQISSSVEDNFKIGSYFPIHSGLLSPSFTYIVENQNHTKKYFCKIYQSEYLGHCIAQIASSIVIASTGIIQTPRVLCWGLYNGKPYAVWEYIKMRTVDDWILLAKSIAELHTYTSPHGFGWYMDYGCPLCLRISGANRCKHIDGLAYPDPLKIWDSLLNLSLNPSTEIVTNHCNKPWINDWSTYFIDIHLIPQIAELHSSSNDKFTLDLIENCIFVIEDFLSDYQPKPVLLHGDLNIRNIGFTQAGKPVIFDLMSFYGDRELDFKILPRTFPDEFYTAYQSVFPFSKGFEVRSLIYDLFYSLFRYNYTVSQIRYYKEIVNDSALLAEPLIILTRKVYSHKRKAISLMEKIIESVGSY